MNTVHPLLTSSPALQGEQHESVQRDSPEQTGATDLTAAATILAVLRKRDPMVFTKGDLATLLPSSVRMNAYGLFLRILEEKGLITITDNRVALTQVGRNPSPTLLTEVEKAERTLAVWKRKLPPGAGKIFTLLTDMYPKQFTKMEIAIALGYSYRSGWFGKQYRLLKDNGLLEVHGQQVKASEALFLAA